MRLRTLWQKALLYNQDLKDRGATPAQRVSLVAQKTSHAVFPAQSLRRRIYEGSLEPLLQLALSPELLRQRSGQPLWNRSQEFEPVKGPLEQQGVLEFPQFSAPRCSILIPVFNQWRTTYRCLQSILQNTQGVGYEVLVLDDASSDETIQLARVVKGVRFIRQPQNLGFLKNCNAGATHARGETLVFLNNDTWVEPEWLSALHAVLDQDPKVGLVGAKLLDAQGYLQEAGGIVWQDGSGWNYGRGMHPGRPEFSYEKEVDYCSGACLLIPRALWQKLNGFDETFAPAYYEDTDLAFRVRKLGLKCMYTPRAQVVHLEGISHGTDVTKGVKRHQAINKERFYGRWKGSLKESHSVGPSQLFQARDCSQTRRHVLVIDTTVPAYDTNAGARLTYMYTKLFAQQGYGVHFAPADMFNPYRYTQKLEELGIEVLYGSHHGPRHSTWLKQHGHALYAVYIHRPDVADAYLPIVKQFAPQAKRFYQCHDLHFVRTQRQFEVEGGVGQSPESQRWKEIEMRVMAEMDVIHTPSTSERDWIQEQFPDKKVQDVPIFLYDKIPLDGNPDDGGDISQRKGLLFVGGASHPPNVDAMQWFLEEVFPQLREEFPDVTLTIVGKHMEKLFCGIPGVICTGWIPDEELEMLYRTSRLAVFPLRYGAGVKGKVIEAAAWGLPIVGSVV
ncbi:MAG: glycosyltransferase, partial [Burkholderiaceae bacterium]|nr:glycosyltransferase [Burkholderiaceae bacterium]